MPSCNTVTPVQIRFETLGSYNYYVSCSPSNTLLLTVYEAGFLVSYTPVFSANATLQCNSSSTNNFISENGTLGSYCYWLVVPQTLLLPFYASYAGYSDLFLSFIQCNNAWQVNMMRFVQKQLFCDFALWHLHLDLHSLETTFHSSATSTSEVLYSQNNSTRVFHQHLAVIIKICHYMSK